MYKVKIKRAWMVVVETESESFPVSMPYENKSEAENQQIDVERILALIGGSAIDKY